MSDNTTQVLPEGTDDIESQTVGIYTNLTIGAIITVASLIIFEIFRRKVPAVFEARRILHDQRDPLDYHNNRVYSPPSPSYRLFGWIRPVLHLEIDTIARTHGYDTALYLRYLRTMMFLFLVLLIPTVPLLPIYYTGTFNDSRDTDEDKVIGVQKFSLSNVAPDDAWRYWITLAVDYIVVAIVLLIVFREFTVFTRYRIDYRCSNNPANYAILVDDIPKSQTTESQVLAYWNQIFPGEVKKIYMIKNGKKLLKKIDEFWKTVNNREVAQWQYAYNPKLKGERPQHKVGKGPSCFLSNASKVDSIEHYTEEQNKLANTISGYQENNDASISPVTKSAIVIFHTKRIASIAAQTNFQSKENEWRVQRAPEPNAINWPSFGIPGYQIGVRNVLTITFSMALTLLWIIPITFIMGLTNLKSLAALEISGGRPFDFLNNLIEWSPQITGIIESTLPAIILSVFLSLVPTFLRLFINISRVSSNSAVDIRVRDWYFNFVIFSNFLFVIVSGSLLGEISKIVDKPSRMASLLASSAPRQGAFMINFIILKATSETPKEILQLGRVIVRWVMLKFLSKTQRQKNNVWVGNTQFQFFRYYAISQLITLLGIIYSTISPFIVPVCLLYYAIMYIVWKYNLCFSMYNTYQDGGYMYGGALYGTWVALFLHLITMIGIFGLKGNPAQSILIIIPAAIMLAYFRMIRVSFTKIAKHGSSLESMKRAEESDEGEEITDDLVSKYLQTAFIPLPNPIEDLSGVDKSVKHELNLGNDKRVTVVGVDDDDIEKGKDNNNNDDEDNALNNRSGMQNYFSTSDGTTKSKSKSTEEWVDADNGDNNNGTKTTTTTPNKI